MKNFMKVVIMAIVLLTTTSCGVLDASLQRSRLAESLHTGMTNVKSLTYWEIPSSNVPTME